MGPYGPTWAHIGPYGPVWARVGPARAHAVRETISEIYTIQTQKLLLTNHVLTYHLSAPDFLQTACTWARSWTWVV